MKDRHRSKRFSLPLALALIAGMAMGAGCMGTNAITQKVRKGNLSVVENRWGREGIFLGLNICYVYRVTTLLDLLIFNSIEFWSGENPVNGRSALVNMPMSEVEEKFGLTGVNMAQFERLSDTEAKLYLGFEDGDRLSFDVTRSDDSYTVSYLGREFHTGRIGQTVALD